MEENPYQSPDDGTANADKPKGVWSQPVPWISFTVGFISVTIARIVIGYLAPWLPNSVGMEMGESGDKGKGPRAADRRVIPLMLCVTGAFDATGHLGFMHACIAAPRPLHSGGKMFVRKER